MVFTVTLKQAHEKSGKSVYRVSKETGLARQTVTMYAKNDEVRVDILYPVIVTLAEYYGVNWKDVVSAG